MTHFVLAFAGLATAWAAPACDGDASSPVTASAIAHAADAELVGDGKPFARVANGTARLTFEARGISGNPLDFDIGWDVDGAYLTYAFAEDALPDGMCDNVKTGTLCAGEAFVLGPADAVAFYGCTPPPVAYFGFDAILQVYPRIPFQSISFFVYLILL